MKNLFTIAIISLHIFIINMVYGQAGNTEVSITQSFEGAFNLSLDNCTGIACNVEIIKNYFANEAKTTSRIYRETKSAINGSGSLGMVPIGTFTPTVEIKIPVAEVANLKKLNVQFDAKSLKNGSIANTKYATLYYAYTTDSEVIYTDGKLIDVFMNKDSDVKKYQFDIDFPSKNFKEIKLKLYATWSKDSAGTCAKVIIDDIATELQYNALAIDDISNLYNQSFQIINQMDTKIELNAAISGQILNTMGIVLAEIKNTSEINTSTLTSGVYFIKATNHQNIAKFYVK